MIRNKACNKYRNFFLLVFVTCLILFNFLFAGCGLDVFYDVPAPVVNNPKLPEIDSLFNEMTFSFVVPVPVSSSGFKVDGTDIYYKIYADQDVWKTETDNLRKKDGYDLFSTLNDTYKYQMLKVTNYNESPLIPSRNVVQTVNFRLTDYSDMDAYSASFSINGTSSSGGKDWIPIRENGKSFNFGRNDGMNKPVIGNSADNHNKDKDVNGVNTPNNGKWYVALFAVTKGHASDYSNHYSNILYLGSVAICDTEANN